MMIFSLRVIESGQSPHERHFEANSKNDAIKKAEQQGLMVLSAKPIHNKVLFSSKKKSFEILLFCQEFKVLLDAGLSIKDVIETLIQKETNMLNQNALKQLLVYIEEGKTLSQAMQKLDDVFPSLLITSIKTAETTGNISAVLSRYVQYTENIDVLKKRIVSASIYPGIVIGFGLLVFGFLLIHVIPKFSKIYESQVQNSSESTKILLWLGEFSGEYGFVIIVMLIMIILIVMWGFSQKNIVVVINAWLWNLPYIGEKIKLYHLSRLYRTFSMLLKSGVTVSHGLGLVQTMLNTSLQHNLMKAKFLISEGKSFSLAFEEAELSTAVAKRLFKIGEQSGSLDVMMEHAAAFHEEEMIRWVDKITKIIEPALMAIIGVLIGGLVLMMYLPIFDLASGID